MTPSREDAISMLSKWQNESTPVSGSFESNGFALFFRGCISVVSEIDFKITHHPKRIEAPGTHFEIIVHHGFVKEYKLRDPSDVPVSQEGALVAAGTGLTMRLRPSGTLSIVARKG